jgi:pyruvate dehydrogenase E2 component (dihydrolipoamide acetyltransferase)
MKHIETGGTMPLSAFRKISIGNWRHPRDPQTYAEVELNAEPALRFLEGSPSDVPLTLTHYITKILGDCFARQPELNSVLLRGKLYRRKEISAFITTLLKQKGHVDLGGFSIQNIDRVSIDEIASNCEQEVQRLRRGEDPDINALQNTLSRVPVFLLTPLFHILDFFKYTMNFSTKSSALPRDRFGTVIITNIGALGLQNALVPLTPCSRTPLLIAVGKPFEGVTAVDGEVRVMQRIKIGITFDHRYIDGYHGSKIVRRFTKIFEAPEKHAGLFAGETAAMPNT